MKKTLKEIQFCQWDIIIKNNNIPIPSRIEDMKSSGHPFIFKSVRNIS